MPSAMVSQSPLRVPCAMRNASPAAGVTDVLAREPRADDVHRFDLLPVELGQVSEVRDVRMMNAQQLAHVPVVVGNPSAEL